MHWLVLYIWSFGLAVGPVIGYLYQYKLIKQKQTVGTFSINICGVLLFCNILRIGFYIFRQYSIALLIQSFLMIAAQIILLKECVMVMDKQGKFTEEVQVEGILEDFRVNFWKWRQPRKYFIVIGFFSIVVLIFSFSLRSITDIGDVIGFISLVSESLLMLPQVIENMRQKKVKGLSHLLVGLNNVGDLMKLAFFILNSQPLQFVICGIVQCFIDGFVIVQICYYKSNKQEGKTDEIVVQIEFDQKKAGQNIENIDERGTKSSQFGTNYNQLQDER